MKKNILFTLFFFLNLILNLNLISCNTTDPKLEPDLKLELKDVSCTEAWLQLTTNNIQLPATINLLKNNSVTQTFSLITQDSLLYIDSLLPNQNYSFQASSIQSAGGGPVSSNKATAATLDTTSHNFSWQTFTFGNGGSSVLYDVAIIDENNIWAVGEIYMNDSLGNPDPICYNAAHWNGQRWEFKRIMFYTFCPQGTGEGPYPAQSVFAIDDQSILISSGSQVAYLSNGVQIKKECVPVSVNKIWGTSINDIYIVGYGGSIAHYQNGSWTKIESGTDVDLKDVYGTSEGSEIWTCGWNYQTGQSMILKIKQNDTQIIWDSEIPDPKFVYSGLINSICSNGNCEFVFVGGQVYRQSLLDGLLARREWVKTENGSKVLELGNYGYRIKSSNKNNIAVVGDAAMIWHYNGSTWYKFIELYNQEDRLYGLAITDNLIVAVGKRYTPGTLGLDLIILGRR